MGAIRGAGQLIAYELPMVLAVIGVVIQAGTLNMQEIVYQQSGGEIFGIGAIGNPYILTQFVGFIGGWKTPGALSPVISAILAATLTTWVTFAPSFLWIFAGAPWLDDLLRNRTLAGALQGITAAVVGAISWLAFWFALNTIFRGATFMDLGPIRMPKVSLADLDLAALALAVLAVVLTFVLKRSMLQVIAICAGLGVVWKLSGLG